MVYAGSRAQVGEPVYLPVDESHPDNPTDVYGINKLAAEQYVLLYGAIYDMPVVSLRLNNVYGPRGQIRHGYYGVVSWFIGNIMTGKSITVYGKGDQTRDYVYIDDVVDAFVRVAQSSAANGNAFLVASGVETVFLDMVKTIIEVMGKGRYVHVPFPEDREKIDIKRFVATYARLHDTVGWEPSIALREGLKRTVDFYDSRLARYLQKPALE
jgi:nucleoside-diphosphate-sugar epimerase